MDSYAVLDHGWIKLENCCADDLSVVRAARVSFDRSAEELDDAGIGLINFLMRNGHGTPFEHSFFRFVVKLPIFVVREWHRHRVGHSYNEQSGRYSKIEPEFYVPDYVRAQVGKPGAYRYEEMTDAEATLVRAAIDSSAKRSLEIYEKLLEDGVAKEQARVVMPVNTYTKMYWSCNARSLMHFLGLRNAPDAMFEIRQYAEAAEELFSECMPVTHEAFIGNNRKAP